MLLRAWSKSKDSFDVVNVGNSGTTLVWRDDGSPYEGYSVFTGDSQIRKDPWRRYECNKKSWRSSFFNKG